MDNVINAIVSILKVSDNFTAKKNCLQPLVLFIKFIVLMSRSVLINHRARTEKTNKQCFFMFNSLLSSSLKLH